MSPYINIFFTLLSLLVLAACSDDFPERTRGTLAHGTYPDDAYFIISDSDEMSRAEAADVYRTHFEAGDSVGIFVLEADGSLTPGQPQNALYTVYIGDMIGPEGQPSGEKFYGIHPADDSQRQAKGHPKYVFYYPYIPGLSYDEACALTHSVSVDQTSSSQDKSRAFEISDLLWTVEQPTTVGQGERVIIDFDHAMASFAVYLPKDEYEVSQPVQLLNMPVTASGINLSTGSLSEMEYAIDPNPAHKANLQMWDAGSNVRQREIFRCVVPASVSHGQGYTIPAGTPILRAVPVGQNNACDYKLSSDLTIYPGCVYELSMKVKNPTFNPQEPWKDGDSWVLDVLDPVTGKPVALLCREYIYYCPADAPYNSFNWMAPVDNVISHILYTTNPDPDNLLGGQPASPNGTFCINSQAWVLYQLDPRGIPDLHSGQILRVVYDICPAAGTAGYWEFRNPDLRQGGVHEAVPQNGNKTTGQWPQPHVSIMGAQGIFTPEHGHEWRPSSDFSYGYSSQDSTEYYMHGATLSWDASDNRIATFQMPSTHVSNTLAKQWGHVAIPLPGMGGRPYVSYSPVDDATLTDQDGCRVGVLVQHCLVDTRLQDGHVMTNAYPLVKIGFNTFWMQQDFRAHSFRGDESMVTFNYRTDNPDEYCRTIFETPNSWSQHSWTRYGKDDVLPPGYIYPAVDMRILDDGFPEATRLFDPFNEFGGSEEQCDLNQIPKLYNWETIVNPKFVPVSPEYGASYHLPSVNDLRRLRRYVGTLWSAKLLKGSLRTVDMSQPGLDGASVRYLETVHSAMMKGKYFRPNGNLNSYVADISGFNLTGFGHYNTSAGDNSNIGYVGSDKFSFIDNNTMGGQVTLWIDAGTNDYMTLLNFNPYDCWASNAFSDYFIDKKLNYMPKSQPGWEQMRSRTFAPVRFVLEFDQRARSTQPLSSAPREKSRASRPRVTHIILQ